MLGAQPTLWIVAGPNGSGKSTFVERFLGDFIFVNADIIAKTMTGENPDAIAKQAMFAAEAKRNELMAARTSFVTETVFSHESKLELIRDARAKGYFVHLIFICTADPTLNAGRVLQRVALGGHRVPLHKIAARYARAIANAKLAAALVNKMTIYDNTTNNTQFQFVASVIEREMVAVCNDPPQWFSTAFC